MKKLIFIFGILLGGFAVASPGAGDIKLFYDQNGKLYTGKYLTYHENGNINAELSISNGKIVGSAKFYYESGELMELGQYINGQKEGEWVKYNKSGKITSIAVFREGEKDGTWLIYDNEGKQKLFEMHYKSGNRIGTWKQWDVDGNLIASKDY